MALKIINGPIIAAGASLSNGVDCSGGDVVRLTLPAAWTPANLSFQVSTDGVLYNDLFDIEGNEIVLQVITGAAMPISKEWSRFWNFIKFRSGTRGYPVAQEAQRDFALTLDVPPGARRS